MKYRKKPIIIEAFQMTEKRRWDNSEWPNWLHKAWQEKSDTRGGLWCHSINTSRLFLGTLEGNHEVSRDDWIIRGVEGELYPCKPSIFERTYEEVIDDQHSPTPPPADKNS